MMKLKPKQKRIYYIPNKQDNLLHTDNKGSTTNAAGAICVDVQQNKQSICIVLFLTSEKY